MKDGKSGEVTCFSCGQKGHYANDPTCPKYVKQRPPAKIFVARVVDDMSDREQEITMEEETPQEEREHNEQPLEDLVGSQYSVSSRARCIREEPRESI